jgi:glycerol kinase
MLMDIEALKWDKNMCYEFGVPLNSLPQIHSCSELFGYLSSDYPLIAGLPITG